MIMQYQSIWNDFNDLSTIVFIRTKTKLRLEILTNSYECRTNSKYLWYRYFLIYENQARPELLRFISNPDTNKYKHLCLI